MRKVRWLEEILIRGRPDGTFAAHMIEVEAIEDGDELIERGRRVLPIDVAQAGALIGLHEAEIVARSDAAGKRADAAEAAVKEKEAEIGRLAAELTRNAETISEQASHVAGLRADLYRERRERVEERAQAADQIRTLTASAVAPMPQSPMPNG